MPEYVTYFILLLDWIICHPAELQTHVNLPLMYAFCHSAPNDDLWWWEQNTSHKQLLCRMSCLYSAVDIYNYTSWRASKFDVHYQMKGRRMCCSDSSIKRSLTLGDKNTVSHILELTFFCQILPFFNVHWRIKEELQFIYLSWDTFFLECVHTYNLQHKWLTDINVVINS
jgi:hypothetical protein